MTVQGIVERVARESYGKLVAILSARTHDIGGAEDALQSAFAMALSTWPTTGVPARPEAWLLTVARNRTRDLERHDAVVRRVMNDVLREEEDRSASTGQLLDDRRLDLLFVCAHPSLDAGVRPALMLQTIFGLTAAEIAKLYVTSPASLEKRLTRAKSKIRKARVSFSLPDGEALPSRVLGVLTAIYAAFQFHRTEGELVNDSALGSTADAVILARLVVHRFPREAEALGLLSLLLFCSSRARASVSADSCLIPLERQSTVLWDKGMIEEAEALLYEAHARHTPGRFQLEAAIQSAHTARLLHGIVNWIDIVRLYEQLLRTDYSLGAELGYLSAFSNLAPPDEVIAELDRRVTAKHLAYQPYWALRAHLEHRAGRTYEARSAFTTAIGLTVNPSVRVYLEAQRDVVLAEGHGA